MAILGTYQIGRSKYNTVMIESVDGCVRVNLTENGGRYHRNCPDMVAAVRYLADMWCIGVLSDVPFDEVRAKVLSKVKLLAGSNVLA